jgi:hypothetical protein
VVGFQFAIGDGNGQELYATTVHWARRTTGEWIRLDPYWWFSEAFANVLTMDREFDMHDFERQTLTTAVGEMNRMRQTREAVVDKKAQYLRRAFDGQYQKLLERLTRYQQTDSDHRNSALINQTTVRLRDLESRRRVRLERLDRERAIQIRPMRGIYAAHLEPLSDGGRIIPQDWEPAMQDYVLRMGYRNLSMFPAFGFVDFYAETEAGEPVYLIGRSELNRTLPEGHLQDLQRLEGRVIICDLNENAVTGSHPV